MKNYGIEARGKRKRSVYPGKASCIVPNLLREPKRNVLSSSEVSSDDTATNASESLKDEDILNVFEVSSDENITNVPQETQAVVFSDLFEGRSN